MSRKKSRGARRGGQMELVGVAFIVVFVVLSILLYAVFSANNPDKLPTQQIRSAETLGKLLHTTMLETHVPACQSTLERAIINCVESPYLRCGSQSICTATHEAWQTMIAAVLGDESSQNQINHRAAIELNGQVLDREELFLQEPFPETCNEDSLVYAAPQQPLPSDAGTVYSIVQFCP